MVGGDKVDYPGDKSTPTSELTTAKCLINSILSTANAKGLCIDIKNFYLNTDTQNTTTPTHCRLHRKFHVHLDNKSYSVLQGCANLEINLDTSDKGLTTRLKIQNPRLRLSQTLNTYLTKYILKIQP